MSYSIHISDNRKFLCVVVKVDVTVPLACKWSAEMQNVSQTSGIRRFLIDVRGSRNISDVLENYMFAYKHADELKLERNTRYAILVSPGDSSHDFVETVMRNCGYYVRRFVDESSAVDWLEEDTP